MDCPSRNGCQLSLLPFEFSTVSAASNVALHWNCRSYQALPATSHLGLLPLEPRANEYFRRPHGSVSQGGCYYAIRQACLPRMCRPVLCVFGHLSICIRLVLVPSHAVGTVLVWYQ